MTELLTQNGKMRKSSENSEYVTYNWGIPAYKSRTGLVTCPMAGSCGRLGGCYALQGSYTWRTVANAYEWRLEQSLSDSFVQLMSDAIAVKQRTAIKHNKRLVIRIHDSGDFYSMEYIRKWLEIIHRNADVQFYAYTKQVPIFRRLELPINFTVIYSEGGLADDRINTATDRHSRVFSSLDELHAAGYDDATEDDSVAWRSTTGRIGLVYHGYKSKQWTTNNNNEQQVA